ncbi:Protein of unknown function, partial [Gryllus bimaculatus]
RELWEWKYGGRSGRFEARCKGFRKVRLQPADGRDSIREPGNGVREAGDSGALAGTGQQAYGGFFQPVLKRVTTSSSASAIYAKLEPPGQIYFSGQNVAGNVRVDLDSCLTVQGITVRVVGEAAVRVMGEPGAWTARRLRRAQRRLRN